MELSQQSLRLAPLREQDAPGSVKAGGTIARQAQSAKIARSTRHRARRRRLEHLELALAALAVLAVAAVSWGGATAAAARLPVGDVLVVRSGELLEWDYGPCPCIWSFFVRAEYGRVSLRVLELEEGPGGGAEAGREVAGVEVVEHAAPLASADFALAPVAPGRRMRARLACLSQYAAAARLFIHVAPAEVREVEVSPGGSLLLARLLPPAPLPSEPPPPHAAGPAAVEAGAGAPLRCARAGRRGAARRPAGAPYPPGELHGVRGGELAGPARLVLVTGEERPVRASLALALHAARAPVVWASSMGQTGATWRASSGPPRRPGGPAAGLAWRRGPATRTPSCSRPPPAPRRPPAPASSPPHIESVSSVSEAGGRVTIRGANFGPLGTPVTVLVGGQACRAAAVTVPHAEAECEAPPGEAGRAPLPLVLTAAGLFNAPSAAAALRYEAEGGEGGGGRLLPGGPGAWAVLLAEGARTPPASAARWAAAGWTLLVVAAPGAAPRGLGGGPAALPRRPLPEPRGAGGAALRDGPPAAAAGGAPRRMLGYLVALEAGARLLADLSLDGPSAPALAGPFLDPAHRAPLLLPCAASEALPARPAACAPHPPSALEAHPPPPLSALRAEAPHGTRSPGRGRRGRRRRLRSACRGARRTPRGAPWCSRGRTGSSRGRPPGPSSCPSPPAPPAGPRGPLPAGPLGAAPRLARPQRLLPPPPPRPRRLGPGAGGAWPEAARAYGAALVKARVEPGPYVSFVVVARNDDYGGDLARRFQVALAALGHAAHAAGMHAELLVVEWNPPEGRPRVAEEFVWPLTPRLAVAVAAVPSGVHAALPNSDRIPLFEWIGKNVGARRARGEFVAVTNQDVLLSPALAAFLGARRLDPSRFYLSRRYNLAPALHPELPPPAALAVAAAFAQTALLFDPPEWSRGFEPGAAGPGVREPEELLLDNPGDLLLMHRDAWAATRGYPEVATSGYVDYVLPRAAAGRGLRFALFDAPAALFHQQHAKEHVTRPGTRPEELPAENPPAWGMAGEPRIATCTILPPPLGTP
eukprot:tig00020537_g10264.t1